MFSIYIQVLTQLICVSKAEDIVDGPSKVSIESGAAGLTESTVSPESIVDEMVSTATFTNTVCVPVVEEACVGAGICREVTAESAADLEACIGKKGRNCSNIIRNYVVSKSIDYVPIGEACRNTQGACFPRRQCVADAVPTTTSASVSPNWVLKATDTGCIQREEIVMEADGSLVQVDERISWDLQNLYDQGESPELDAMLERCSKELTALAEVSSEELSAFGGVSPDEEDKDIQAPSLASGWGVVLISLFC